MLFNSFLFIFIFLPITLIGWYALNQCRRSELAKTFLAGMSLWFYGYFNFYYLAIIIVSIIINYLLSFALTFAENKKREKTTCRVGLLTGIVFNLGLLFYFKYY
ncbi:MAG: MBOAT family protein, partial [Lachnospiraceae bacterium]|nr:MBOAT family protein [Lachnospiraceae bacterium]